MGVQGVSEYEREALILSRPPAILWVLSHRWESTSPRRAEPCSLPTRVQSRKGAAGAHPRVASLGLRPINLQPPLYGVLLTMSVP